MIVFFTGGDDLEESKESLGDYLGRESPKALEKRAMELHKQQRKVDSFKEEYAKDAISEFEKQIQQTYDDKLKRITEMVLFTSMTFYINHFN
ncbi:hypothetical protein LR48_Vigan06g022500 [Vigna angularis]|uniref:Uncharacterized protein n=1 Tax=Phaseolus angularis TaxID=3914 RepID=A0A0L9UQV0_PHAAN|nr:hypothetical protein LR48_Vigan06g022500 [Vigna angularis]